MPHKLSRFDKAAIGAVVASGVIIAGDVALSALERGGWPQIFRCSPMAVRVRNASSTPNAFRMWLSSNSPC
ncbi:MAG: hypothetical protein JWN75_156 [Candidatus Saccharibacteria bacterium]|nr:hypothetical protein [Candidatus Saccharibacteria bacterium]